MHYPIEIIYSIYEAIRQKTISLVEK